MWTRKDWFFLAGLTAVAALFRFYRLGEVPPGFQFDEAFNAIDAQQVLQGNYPLFLPANGGREALYTYWQALWGAVFGVDVYAMRFSSAVLGTLTVPVTYVMLRKMLRVNGRYVAGLTALVLATSLWHVQFSRYGIRVISMPILLCAVFLFFWLGEHAATRRRQITAYAASGLFLGLTPWTHPTGRLVPIVLAVYVIWLLLRRKETRRFALDAPVGGLFISGIVALLVFMPLGVEFLQHPDFFFGHASEVSVFANRVSEGSPFLSLLGNMWRVVAMFSIAGDTDWTHNLAGRPVFDLLMSVPFVIGIGLWVWRLRRADDPDFDALSLLAAWALLLLSPTVLSEAAPNYSRALPSLPALFVSAGLGLTWIALLKRPVAWFGPLAASAIIFISATLTAYDYFVRFAQDRAVYYTYDADKLDALDYLADLTTANRVFLSQLWGDKHATVYFLRGQLGIDSIDTSETLVLPPEGMGLVYGFPSEQQERAEQIAALWPDASVEVKSDPYDNHLMTVVRVPAESAAAWPEDVTPDEEIEARFFEAPSLVGLRSDPDEGTLSLFWRGDQHTFRDLTAFVHLIDQDGSRVGQVDKLPANGSYLTPYWGIGDRVVDQYTPELTDVCTGGESVRVVVGWYQYLADNARMNRTDGPGDSALAGFTTLPLESFSPDLIDVPLSFPQNNLGELAVIGAEIRSATLEPGAPLTVDLIWAGTESVANDEFSLLLAQGENEILLAPGPQAVAPGANWRVGEVICRRLRTHLPQDVAPGRYDLVVRTASGDHLLSEVELELSERAFDLPQISEALDAQYSNLIALRGYDTAWEDRGDGDLILMLDLVWQSLALPVGDNALPHQVFVHVIDETGALRAQSDQEPAGGYSTNSWLPGEVVVDRHEIELPAALAEEELRLLIGIYEPVSNRRLSATDSDGTRFEEDAVPVNRIDVP